MTKGDFKRPPPYCAFLRNYEESLAFILLYFLLALLQNSKLLCCFCLLLML